MSPTLGHKWAIPGGHVAIETEGSTRDSLRLLVLSGPAWLPPKDIPRALCTPLPMRYYGGQLPASKETT